MRPPFAQTIRLLQSATAPCPRLSQRNRQLLREFASLFFARLLFFGFTGHPVSTSFLREGLLAHPATHWRKVEVQSLQGQFDCKEGKEGNSKHSETGPSYNKLSVNLRQDLRVWLGLEGRPRRCRWLRN